MSTNEPSKTDAHDELMDGTSAITPMTTPVVEITNHRYQSNPFWGGPKGLEYGLLRGRLPIQLANYYPDQNSTYFVGQFSLPEDAYLEFNGYYGHLRYFSWTLVLENGDVLGNGSFLRDEQIVPDQGSMNPFVPGNPRNVPDDMRKYTMYVRHGQPPSNLAPNTLYTGTNSGNARIHLALRSYVPDVGFDGTGNVRLPSPGTCSMPARGLSVEDGLPKVTLHLPTKKQGGKGSKCREDDVTLTGEKMCEVLRASKTAQPQEYPTKQWLAEVASSWDPINAPAVSAPMFQRFWNMDYSVTGGFITDPLQRALEYPASNDGAWLTNPNTVYVVALFSLSFGEVVVIKGKMPSFPDTKRGEDCWPSEPTQVRYWSLTTGATAPSGLGWATIFDEEVPLDADGNFTIVMSRAMDRPKNAAREFGVKWIEFGAGEGHYVGARSWVNSVYIRYMDPLDREDWPNSPLNIPPPSPERPAPMDATVMGPYYPRAKYMSKEAFEKTGP